MPLQASMAPEPTDSLDEVLLAYFRAIDAGEQPDPEKVLAQNPDLAEELRLFFDAGPRLDPLLEPFRETLPSAGHPPPEVEPFGDYTELVKIGSGGMGVVYRARQVSLNRTVALKMIRAPGIGSAAEIRRFRQEAEEAASLNHPHIVHIYEVGEHDGRPYFSMQFIEGAAWPNGWPSSVSPRRSRSAGRGWQGRSASGGGTRRCGSRGW
jgi:hypothetical protein